MKGMPSHFIPPLRNFHYPSVDSNYFQIDQAIFKQYYNNYFARLQLNSIDNSATAWYHDNVNQTLGTSFVSDNKGRLCFSPSDNHQWLVFIHSDIAMHMYLACYIVVSGDHIQLFGDGSASLMVDTSAAGLTLSGIDIPLDHTINQVLDDMSSL